MKKFIMLIIGFFVISSAFAQLSTRENDATNVKLGTRPKAGDMSLTFGVPLNIGTTDSIAKQVNGKGKLPSFNSLVSGSMLTFKCYKTDNLAYRFGIRLAKSSVEANGNLDNTNFPDQQLSSYKSKSVSEIFQIMPGIEKHYLNSNIFDIYTGADLLLDYGEWKNENNQEYDAGGHLNVLSRITYEQVGLGAVVGINIFLAQLPVSIGLEYGWSAKYTFGGKERVNYDTNDGKGKSASFTYYTDPNGVAPGNYSSLHEHQFGMDTNQNVNLVLNVYFGKK